MSCNVRDRPPGRREGLGPPVPHGQQLNLPGREAQSGADHRDPSGAGMSPWVQGLQWCPLSLQERG